MPTQRLWPRGHIRVELINQPITELEPNDVFVFGSNATGFHGAGAAGLACRGTARNDWREDTWFTAARDAPVGSPARIGTWAVFGKARGPQRGTEGMSYAIETIQTPGKPRSTSLRDIYRQLRTLTTYARLHPTRRFIVPPLGEGYAGYTRDEMAQVWQTLEERIGIAPNLHFVRMASRPAVTAPNEQLADLADENEDDENADA